jgi:hypothetical protein
MKKVETEMDDELRPEYDLRDLQVKKVGPKRKGFRGRSIQLEPDSTDESKISEDAVTSIKLAY